MCRFFYGATVEKQIRASCEVLAYPSAACCCGNLDPLCDRFRCFLTRPLQFQLTQIILCAVVTFLQTKIEFIEVRARLSGIYSERQKYIPHFNLCFSATPEDKLGLK
jgi:hypothetical protein